MIEYDIQQAVNEVYFANDYKKIMQNVSNDNTRLVESEDDALDENREGIKGDIVYGM